MSNAFAPQQASVKITPHAFGSTIFGATRTPPPPPAASSADTPAVGPALLSSQELMNMPAIPPSTSTRVAAASTAGEQQQTPQFGAVKPFGFGSGGGVGSISAPASLLPTQATSSVSTSMSTVRDLAFAARGASGAATTAGAAAAPVAAKQGFGAVLTASTSGVAIASGSAPACFGTGPQPSLQQAALSKTMPSGQPPARSSGAAQSTKPIYLRPSTAAPAQGGQTPPSDLSATKPSDRQLCPQAIANRAALVRLHEGHQLTRASEELLAWHGLLQYRNETLDEVERLMDGLEADLDASEAQLDGVDQLEQNLFYAYAKASGTRGSANAQQSKTWLEYRDAFFTAMKRHGSTWESCLQRLSALEAGE